MKLRYRYLIYKIYSWTADKRGDTPIGNTILTLSLVHLLTFLLFIDRMVTPLKWMYKFNKTYLFIGLLVYFILFYFLIYNKKRWASYVEEFSSESEKERKLGNFIVIAFLIGSILLFFISLPVLFTLGRKG